MNSSHEITHLLLAWEQGDATALDRLMPLVKDELHRLAHHRMRKEKRGHLLQTTALVNEVFVKLLPSQQLNWQNRAHFYNLVAKCMRQVLVDYARTQWRQIRGKGAEHIALTDAPEPSDERAAEVVALDDALRGLEQQDQRRSRVVELRYFGGFSNEEVAEILGVSVATVERDWGFARAWLQRELERK